MNSDRSSGVTIPLAAIASRVQRESPIWPWSLKKKSDCSCDKSHAEFDNLKLMWCLPGSRICETYLLNESEEKSIEKCKNNMRCTQNMMSQRVVHSVMTVGLQHVTILVSKHM